MRALSLLFGEVEGADFDRHPARGHDLCQDTIYVIGTPRHGRDLCRLVERQTELVLERLKLCVEMAGSSWRTS